jgi:hypothetical protein
MRKQNNDIEQAEFDAFSNTICERDYQQEGLGVFVR